LPRTAHSTFTAPQDTDGDGIADTADNCKLKSNANQRDTDADGIGNACDSDLNNDCVVNSLDLGIFKGSSSPPTRMRTSMAVVS
jgi:hypothetical protein